MTNTTAMNSAKDIHEVIAIMDRSGSMNGKVGDSVGGFNSTLDVLRSEQDENVDIRVSVKLFDHEESILLRSVPLANVEPLQTSQFIPRGQTALLDAMGNTLTFFMEKKLMNPNAYKHCTIYIVTDGLENASRVYSRDRIKQLVQKAESTYNIKVIYLGANQDAIYEAGHLGIPAGQTMNYSESTQETQAAYRSAAVMAGRHRSGVPVEFLPAERTASQAEPTTPPRVQFNIGQPPPIQRQNPRRGR